MVIVLACIALFLMGFALLQIAKISRAITVLSQQLEYLGARLDTGRVGKYRPRTRWVAKSVTYGDGRVEYYIEPDETPLAEGEMR